jgi:hypothetical protein
MSNSTAAKKTPSKKTPSNTTTAKEVFSQIKGQSLPVLRACHGKVLENALLTTLEKCNEKQKGKAVRLISLELEGREVEAEIKRLEDYIVDLDWERSKEREAYVELAGVLAKGVRVELEVKALTQ